MGLQIEQRTDSLKLLLPCLLFSNGKCQTYGFRPKICSIYRCRLLIRVETRKTTLANARRTLESALRMRSRLQHLVEKHFPELADTPIVHVNKLVGERMDSLDREQRKSFHLAHGEFLVALAAFNFYVETHFKRRESIEQPPCVVGDLAG